MDMLLWEFFIGLRPEEPAERFGAGLLRWAELSRPRWMVAYAALLSLVLLLRWRRPTPGPWVGRALLPLLAVGLATALTHVLKLVLARPRPPVEFQLAAESTWALPSGHATAAWALTAAVLLLGAPGWVNLLLGGHALLVSAQRLYLGVHWFSDILVGALLGVLVAGLCWRLLSPGRFHRVAVAGRPLRQDLPEGREF